MQSIKNNNFDDEMNIQSLENMLETYVDVNTKNEIEYAEDLSAAKADFGNESVKVWMTTNRCFPNGHIISIRSFAMIRSFQNFLLFLNFTIIFFNYTLISLMVSRRRNLKMQRLNHFRNVLNESRCTLANSDINSKNVRIFMLKFLHRTF